MRPKVFIFLIISIVVVLMVIFWLRPAKPTITTDAAQTFTQSTNVQAAGANVAAQAVSGSMPSGVMPAPVPKPGPNITNRPTLQDVNEKFIESKNRPIEFYGRVIDQDSNAISGATIKIGVSHWYMLNPLTQQLGAKVIQLEQTSDTDGRFEFHGTTGDGFGVQIIRGGYEMEQSKSGFGSTAGSYGNPEVFKMWSTNVHEQLIAGNKSFPVTPDGRPYFINLTDDTISEVDNGDLKVWIQYTNQTVRGQLYDWSCGIEVINGGLMEQGLGSPMFQAPTDGYAPKFEIHGQIKGGQRSDSGDRQFYLKLKNGQEYGQMTIDLHAPFNNEIPGLIRLSYVINPSGSPILR